MPKKARTKKAVKEDSEKNILVFISYATKDCETFQVPLICERLTKMPRIKDVLYWQEDLQDDIWTYMDKNVGKCDIFVLFCSPNALESLPVSKEWHAADALSKPIIPIFSSVEYIPPLLRPRLGIQVDVFNIEENINKLYDLILKKYIPKEKIKISLKITHKNDTNFIQANKNDPFISPIMDFCLKNNLSIKNIMVHTTIKGDRVPDDELDETVSKIYSKYGNEFIIQIEKMQIVGNFKVCMVGDKKSGKSSLLKHCVKATYDEEYKPTIGVDYWVKPFNYQSIDKNFDIILLFWDFGGDFEDIGKKKELFSESDGIFVVGDMTRRESFKTIETGCVPKIRRALGDDIPIILLSNKFDLEHDISKKEIEDMTKKCNLENLFFTSAKTGINIEEAFKSIIAPIINRELKIL